ncbi:MAG: hypothetical protein CL681_00025, partial [Blastopirellula sp.]|nr:hypothetical protein [Blastopirellula sp.]
MLRQFFDDIFGLAQVRPRDPRWQLLTLEERRVLTAAPLDLGLELESTETNLTGGLAEEDGWFTGDFSAGDLAAESFADFQSGPRDTEALLREATPPAKTLGPVGADALAGGTRGDASAESLFAASWRESSVSLLPSPWPAVDLSTEIIDACQPAAVASFSVPVVASQSAGDEFTALATDHSPAVSDIAADPERLSASHDDLAEDCSGLPVSGQSDVDQTYTSLRPGADSQGRQVGSEVTDSQWQATGLVSPAEYLAVNANGAWGGTTEGEWESSEATSDVGQQQAVESRTAPMVDAGANEVVVIDSRVRGFETLVDGVASDTELVILDVEQDGVRQIADVVRHREGIAALHIVSHGQAGLLQLGTSQLSNESLSEYSDALREIGDSLASDADLLIYGCNVAEGERGASFLGLLSRALDADVAASTDTTGSAVLGGDWDLETNVGAIDTKLAFSGRSQQSYAYTLPVVAETMVTLDAGNLRIEDVNTDTDDHLQVESDGTHYVITDLSGAMLDTDITGAIQSNASTVRVLVSQVTGGMLLVNTAAGSDVLKIDHSQSFVELDVVYAGGVGSDALAVRGDAVADTAVYTPDVSTTGSGQVVVNDDGGATTMTISFAELEPVDVSGMLTATLTLPGAADVLTLSNGFDSATGALDAVVVAGTSGGVAIEAAHFFGNTTVVIDTVTGGADGTDVITVTGADNTHGNTNLTFSTGGGGDVINFDTGGVEVTGTFTIASTNASVQDAGAEQAVDITAADLVVEAATFGGSGVNAALDTDIDTLTMTTTGSVFLQEADTIVFAGTSSIGGDLDVTVDVGNIFDSGTLAVTGAAQFNAAIGLVDLDGISVDGAIGLEAGLARITNATAVDLSQSSIAATLEVNATLGDITDSGSVEVGGSAQFNAADGMILLDQLDVGEEPPVQWGQVTVGNQPTFSSATLAFHYQQGFSPSVPGNLGVGTAPASVPATLQSIEVGYQSPQSGSLYVFNKYFEGTPNDLATLSVGGAEGLLGVSTSVTNNVFTFDDLILPNVDDTYFFAADFSATALITANYNSYGNSSVPTGQFLSAVLSSSSNFGADFLTLGDDDIEFTAVVQAVNVYIGLNATESATIVNANSVDLSASSIGGDLQVTASAGSIVDSETVQVAGMAQFNAAAGTLTLDDLQVTGSIGLTAQTTATIVNASSIDLKASTVGTDLMVTATTGDITDSGLVDVSGMAQFTSSGLGNDILLDTLAVDGMLGLTTTESSLGVGDAHATVVNASAIDFKATTVQGDLDATATSGGITDAVTVTVSGMAQFTSSGLGDDIVLDATVVGGMLGLATKESVSGAADGHATFVHATGIEFKQSDVEGNLNATAITGGLTDASVVSVSGMAQFTSSGLGDDILLDTLAVDGMLGLTTTESLLGLGDAHATVVNASAIDFKATTVQGDLDATAASGGITDAATVVVSGMAQFTSSGLGDDIVLDVTLVGGMLGLATKESSSGAADGHATFVHATGIEFKQTDVEGNLQATATTGGLTDASVVSVSGMAQFTSSGLGDDILLDALAVEGMLGLTTTESLLGVGDAHATVVNASAIDFKATAVQGDLDATATSGGMTDAATVTVSGMAQFTSSGLGDDILLDTLSVDGMLGLTTTESSLGLGDAHATVVNASAIEFKVTTVQGDLDATATSGGMTDAASVTVSGMAQFTTSGLGADIVLDATLVGGMLGLSTTESALGAGDGDVTFLHAAAVDLKASEVQGALLLNAAGDVTDSGAVVIRGTTTLSATGEIILDQVANDFGGFVTVLTGTQVKLADGNDLGLAGVLITGDMLLDVAGNVVQQSSSTIASVGLGLMVAGTTTLQGANDVDTLAAANGDTILLNDVDGVTVGSVSVAGMTVSGVTTSDDDVKLTAGGNVDLAASIALGAGDLLVVTSGALSQQVSGTITSAGVGLMVDGTTTLQAANDVDTLAAMNGGETLFNDVDGVTVGSVTVDGMSISGVTTSDDDVKLTAGGNVDLSTAVVLGTGDLLVATSGALSQQLSGTITSAGLGLMVDGTTTLQATNDVDTLAAANGDEILFNDVDGLAVGSVSVGGMTI